MSVLYQSTVSCIANMALSILNTKVAVPVLGEWASKSVNTIYQAATDGTVKFYKDGGGSEISQIKTDGSNPPTTIRHKRQNSNYGVALSCEVKKGDYWKCEDGGTGSSTIYWIPVLNT